jgi:(E)-4-hydroxy-3-methylbut-2-enyl-diphosphate synthase
MPDPPATVYAGNPRRRATRGVRVGPLIIGDKHAVVIQSMTVSDTLDTDAVVAEVKSLVAAGCPLVRLTAPSIRDAENLREIRRRLEAEGIRVPMAADIHFTPNAAVVAAAIVEKVRINPGNYADRKRFAVREYTDAEYAAEVPRVAQALRPLVEALQAHGGALRIGTNHGSLSDRVMNRFGDTPAGMVESALEFVRAGESMGFRDIVLSMKSSVPGVMIAAYRLLAVRLDEAGMDYPLHLGVTEAGDGLEARVKSAIGIGSLLVDGIGDTIRVSLAEDSVHELPAARAILAAVEEETGAGEGAGEGAGAGSAPSRGRVATIGGSNETDDSRRNRPQNRPDHAGPAWWKSRTDPQPRRRSEPWVLGQLGLGGDFPVRVEARASLPVGRPAPVDTVGPGQASGAANPSSAPASRSLAASLLGPEGDAPEFVSVRPVADPLARPSEILEALDAFRLSFAPQPVPPLLLEWTFLGQGEVHLLEAALRFVDGLSLGIAGSTDPGNEDRFRLLARLLLRAHRPVRFRLPATEMAPGAIANQVAALCRGEGLNTIGFLCASGPRWIERTRDLALGLAETRDPIFLEVPSAGPLPALRAGAVLLDGIGDSLCLDPSIPATPWPAGGRAWSEERARAAWTILQACRLRLTRAEFIACPSCGRTQFDLQSVTATIRARTEHLRGVKIAVMGCIVNGPGEMADADFGYVGSGPGKVDLYVGKERVRQGVAEAEAPERLIELIREHGSWIEPGDGTPSAP